MLKRLKVELYWSPDGLPAKTNIRQWITIHDLNFEHHPQWVPATVAKYYRKNIKRGAEVADKVFTVSHWSKNDLKATYGLPEDKILVTYNAPQWKFESGPSIYVGQYFCAVGALTPRKNLKTLLLAFDKWCSSSNENFGLLRIAGEPHFSDPELKSVVEGLKYPDRIEWMGRLNPKELEMLYRGAIAYCMPSAMEGFGIPLVEAMQCGTPVIASDNSAITEVVADKGLLVPTYDIDAWAAALERMQQERTHWSALALERGKDFDWATSAQPWIDALKG
jgi:glycosyltransferase involved in cell wall biosynthesis